MNLEIRVKGIAAALLLATGLGSAQNRLPPDPRRSRTPAELAGPGCGGERVEGSCEERFHGAPVTKGGTESGTLGPHHQAPERDRDRVRALLGEPLLSFFELGRADRGVILGMRPRHCGTAFELMRPSTLRFRHEADRGAGPSFERIRGWRLWKRH